MAKIAAQLLVVGNVCHIVDPKGIWTNGVWLTSIFTATFAVLTASEKCVALRKATIISAAITMFCIMLGFISLIKEVKSWPED